MRGFPVLVGLLTASAFACGVASAANHAKVSGLYMTAADFENGRLAFSGNCGAAGHKLAIHDAKPYVDVTNESQEHRYTKSQVFGFHACDGNDYRFGSTLEYQILESKDLYIYAQDVPVSPGKGFHLEREYYFSVGSRGPIAALTLTNLKGAFPSNAQFNASLESTFDAGSSLAKYDKNDKTFEVNRLLVASRQSTRAIASRE